MSDPAQHVALIYQDVDDLLTQVAAARPVPAGPVVLACRPEHRAPLADLLEAAGERQGAPGPVDRLDAHTRPAAAVAAYHRLGGVAPGAVVIGEADHGHDRAAWERAAHFEAALDLTLPGSGITVVCAYPADTPAPLLAAVRRSHPHRLTVAGPVAEAGHADPGAVLRQLAPDRPPPVPAVEPRLRITGSASITDLGSIRRQLTACLADVATLVRTDFVAAVNELLTNSYRHGAPPVGLTLWVTAAAVECRVTDGGAGRPAPDAGYRPSPDARRTGIGLWLARQACDDIGMWRTGETFTVRAATANTRPRLHSGALARAETAHTRAAAFARRSRRPAGPS
ncbi:ATP-binding protein [Symbioplanes lichenis]|uniref:ATP-binding protein n=1 Tax=Symbioplanes lichenis TaxID=1629072 RepID=UPI002739F9FE|nr:ATP-binding protein [Actinoplanes lichenis]